ncbi:TetR/AcrR family transcriptional regulator [Streptacidiphilus jiangxiensis]|uniref:DNA-binding transcriptional regulator, AcrR family n=1 Tax=Streptacidiphilus jiangxiensis TaxID=235985 RepID=A0A1H7FNF5_STRJI|nr:TetR/AcrR family transcriptional regulator [Streptacidiphilus jiangxiensis]SEK27626.1 DNA-binding transcriptional regulator, AcrR family [Streptacidiphilus jiangxiensis]
MDTTPGGAPTLTDPTGGQAQGRREQNKRRTHEALIEAAGQLFQERGYEATTVRDIAAAAGVGERTFFRYFPSKESLVLQQVRDLVPLLAAEIRERPAAEPLLDALRESVLEVARRNGANPAVLLAASGPLRVVTGTEGRGDGRGDRHLLYDMEEAVAAAFTERLLRGGEAADVARLRASVFSRAGVGVLRAVRLAYGRLPEADRAALDPAELVRQAFACLEAGVRP